MIRASAAPSRFARSPLAAAIAAATLGVLAVACESSTNEGPPASRCVAFSKAAPPSLRPEPGAVPARAGYFVRLVQSADGRTYALDGSGRIARLDADAAGTVVVPRALDFAIKRSAAGVQAYVAHLANANEGGVAFELTRYTSRDEGATFDASTAVALLKADGPADALEASMAFAPDGLLYLALGGSASPKDLNVVFGKVLRLDVYGDVAAPAYGNPVAAGQGRAEIWAVGGRRPRGLDVDSETGDVWFTDHSTKDDATLVHRIVRGSAEELPPALVITSPERRATFLGGHVYRGTRIPALIGKYVYPASGQQLVVVDRFGPSGTAQASSLALGTQGALGSVDNGELVVAPESAGVVRIVDGAPPPPVPPSLLASQCFDLAAPGGAPAGAVPYDVTTALWSDGASKERFVVVPAGARITARTDGDLVFPVGTVVVKTFAVDGRRVETRLLVQHDLEDWVGYSYAWNEAGTDAELVNGNRVKPLAGGKSWYFPSSTDCTACHTPAAGYTLGLEAKQLAGHGDALAQLEEHVGAPVAPAGASLVAVDAPAPVTAEARARSYLHANCATCHREGSATGTVVDLDLRIDTPLAKTGLCKEAAAGTLGLATGARIVAPHDPSTSVLVARMRSLDERRMPKLASRVVDEAGVAAVEAWIRDLASCP